MMLWVVGSHTGTYIVYLGSALEMTRNMVSCVQSKAHRAASIVQLTCTLILDLNIEVYICPHETVMLLYRNIYTNLLPVTPNLLQVL